MLHPEKADTPIRVTESGMVALVRSVRPANTLAPISVILSGMSAMLSFAEATSVPPSFDSKNPFWAIYAGLSSATEIVSSPVQYRNASPAMYVVEAGIVISARLLHKRNARESILLNEPPSDKFANSRHAANASNPMYKQIVEFVVAKGQASASLLQRTFHIGYNRAATYIDLLEERGIIGPQNGSKPREVIYKLENNNENE